VMIMAFGFAAVSGQVVIAVRALFFCGVLLLFAGTSDHPLRRLCGRRPAFVIYEHVTWIG
jgi:hypothetical protein